MTKYCGKPQELFSERFSAATQIIFAVAIGTSLIEFHDALFTPSALKTMNFWALSVVYMTAILSFMGWRRSLSSHYYTDSICGRIRALVDAFIVIVYVALLFLGRCIYEHPDYYFWFFFLVFLLYYISGWLKCYEHDDPDASKRHLIWQHGGMYFLIAIGYTASTKTIWGDVLPQENDVFIGILIFMTALNMLVYRYRREWKWLRFKEKVLKTVAVDMDGVIVEQVIPVLERLNKEKGLDKRKDDINEWEYPILNTNIRTEIERAEQDKNFVLEMPPIEGTEEALRELASQFTVVIATSRDPQTDTWSQEWLKRHGVQYQSLLNTHSAGKLLPDADILIDDYINNIDNFIRSGHSHRQAILYAQPWNRDISLISDLIASGRVKIAHSWSAVLAILRAEYHLR